MFCKAIIYANKFLNPIRIDVEKFDGITNFGLWQVQGKDILIQFGYTRKAKEMQTLLTPGDV